jgi:hypothetical protein
MPVSGTGSRLPEKLPATPRQSSFAIADTVPVTLRSAK